MTEFCVDHSGIVKSQGRIEEKVEGIAEDMKEVSKKIDKLIVNGVANDTARITTLKERRWVHWVLVTAVGASILLLVQTIVPKILKALAGALQ